MIDFLEPEHDNPWNFVADELKYEGKLYHYTDKKDVMVFLTRIILVGKKLNYLKIALHYDLLKYPA